MEQQDITEEIDRTILSSGDVRFITEEVRRTEQTVNPDATTASEASSEDVTVETNKWIETPDGRVDNLKAAFHYITGE